MADESESPSPATVDTAMVKHVAFLVRLGIDEAQAQAFSHQFSDIIDYFNLLDQVDTTGVRPASEISNTHTVMRQDEVRPSMPREDFFKNVPHRAGDFVQVPSIFESD